MTLTPKQRVLRRWPKAYLVRRFQGWVIAYQPKNYKVHVYEFAIGLGATPAKAWADASRRIK